MYTMNRDGESIKTSYLGLSVGVASAAVTIIFVMAVKKLGSPLLYNTGVSVSLA